MRVWGSIFLLVLVLFCHRVESSILPQEVALQWLEEIDVYERKLSQHYKHAEGIHNREPYMPFVSGDGFRSIADYIFDETNVGHSESNKLTWTVDPVSINDGAVIFIKVDLLSIFVSSVIPLIRGSYSLIVHNGDNSAPDLQDDYERPYAHYETGRALESEYLNKRLTALHAQNLWWKDRHHNAKPIYAHCIPIGIQNRYILNSEIENYAAALHDIVDGKAASLHDRENALLLVPDITPSSRDRAKLMSHLMSNDSNSEWCDVRSKMDHAEYLQELTRHKFVVAPFGSGYGGLDTHRLTEILMMGAIPVIRESSITSCYDDTDNFMSHGIKRGSLPIVVVKHWSELSKERLENEWIRISSVDPLDWDWSRLTMSHWENRIVSRKHRDDAIAVSFLFIHVGDSLPMHMNATVHQCRLFNPTSTAKIYLLSNIGAYDDYKALQFHSIDVIFVSIQGGILHHPNQSGRYTQFTEVARHMNESSNGSRFVYLLIFSIERFVLLSEFTHIYKAIDVIHLENDVMVYSDFSLMMPAFHAVYSSGLATTFFNDHHGVAGIMYIRSSSEIVSYNEVLFNEYFVNGAPLLTDMDYLGKLQNDSMGNIVVDRLPIMPPLFCDRFDYAMNFHPTYHEPTAIHAYCQYFHEFNNSIFDAAAIGQYLDGINAIDVLPSEIMYYTTIYDGTTGSGAEHDPRRDNNPGFINAESLLSANKMVYEWRLDAEQRFVPYAVYSDADGSLSSIKVNNLHVHSKNTDSFYSLRKRFDRRKCFELYNNIDLNSRQRSIYLRLYRHECQQYWD